MYNPIDISEIPEREIVMQCSILSDFKKVEDESLVSHIKECLDYKRDGWCGGIHYHLPSGEHFATIKDSGECYSRYSTLGDMLNKPVFAVHMSELKKEDIEAVLFELGIGDDAYNKTQKYFSIPSCDKFGRAIVRMDDSGPTMYVWSGLGDELDYGACIELKSAEHLRKIIMALTDS